LPCQSEGKRRGEQTCAGWHRLRKCAGLTGKKKFGSAFSSSSFRLMIWRRAYRALAFSVICLTYSATAPILTAQKNAAELPSQLAAHIAARWSFHRLPDGSIAEEVSGRHAEVKGTVYAARSPVGNALEFDGYTGEIIAAPMPLLDEPVNLGISVWIRLQAYPWNLVPIVDQLDARGSFFFDVDAQGHLHARLGTGSRSYISSTAVPLRRWSLVTLSVAAGNVSFSIDGADAHSEAAPAETSASSPGSPLNLLIGHVRTPQLPGLPRRIHPQFPIEYSIQGSLGQLTVYNCPLPTTDAKELFARADQVLLRPLPWPKFPRWQGGPGPFGAYYTTLHFDPLWDKSRRIGPDSDVVVRFDKSPIQLIFWQGANYVPAWVTENNRWYTDEFMEIYGHPRCPYGEDCEPMSDKQSRYSHVRILESTPARVVVDWRYALSEVEQYAIADAPSPIAWGDWADEYWTIYPDGVAIRRSVLWSTAPQRDNTEFQESIILVPPGETPEENLNYDALTFANLLGQTKSYSWQPKTKPGFSLPHGPAGFPEPQNAVIQWVNLKSRWKPFEVAWGSPVTFDSYNSEMSISAFEWWSHWPVAQIPSSGRPALAADRAGHTSVSHIYWPAYREDAKSLTKVLMDGLTTLQPADLVPLALSWRNPAVLQLQNGREIPYDPAQRAYLLPEGLTSPVRMTLLADREHPVFDVALVVPGWSRPASMQVIRGGQMTGEARIGQVDTLEGGYLVVYIPLKATEDVELRLSSK